MRRSWHTAWITGASSGIGRALALELARRGVSIAASSRSPAKLDALAAECPAVTVFPLDVTDRAAMRTAVAAIERRLGAIDLAIFSAGVWRSVGASAFDAARIEAAMHINYLGVVNGIEAALPSMLARGSGQLALISSLAGYRGFPRAAAYAPTKAALISLAECLKPELDRKGVAISVVNPGFVATPMNADSKGPMPFIISAEDAAHRIVAGLERGSFEIAFPWRMVLLAKFFRILPYPWFFWHLRRRRAATSS
ncbi:MAG TPA: SDR family NAD(P)-dependent oxidoreductase [Hyphomicrobiaceae bacterium]|nr:SDR family NAD(P)-dependent oxidoreductase [Hyphomicrobiaceae bacterium]